MIVLSVEEIREAVAGKIVQGDPARTIKNVSIDSRKIKPGDMFFAIIGERFDGHSFIPEAVEEGAEALIVDRSIKPYPGVAIIIVKDTTRALQDLAHYCRMKMRNLQVIGVTGSVGKTTTKDMIAGILEQKYNVLKSRGNYNNFYGLPLSLLSLEGSEEFAALEFAMSSLGEIERLAEIAVPDIGVVTNVGPAHLESLKTVDNVARAKQELIKGLTEDGIAVLNYDNEYVRRMEEAAAGQKIIYYGMDDRADIYADNVKINENNRNITFDVVYQGDVNSVSLNKPGQHNIYNALAAIAVARELNVDWNDINRGLKTLKMSSLRLDIKENNGKIIINDTYNANPMSMRAGIDALQDIAKGRSIAVLGDMLELGPKEESAHADIGEYVVNSRVDILITVGQLGKIIADGAERCSKGSIEIYSAEDNREVGEILLRILNKGDTVLIKGSRGMRMEEIVNMVLE